MCQVDVKSAEHLNYSVGLKDKIEWTLIQSEPYIFIISYTGSIENRSVHQKYICTVSAVGCKLYILILGLRMYRKVNVTFYEKSFMSEATFLFTGEAPSATYVSTQQY